MFVPNADVPWGHNLCHGWCTWCIGWLCVAAFWMSFAAIRIGVYLCTPPPVRRRRCSKPRPMPAARCSTCDRPRYILPPGLDPGCAIVDASAIADACARFSKFMPDGLPFSFLVKKVGIAQLVASGTIVAVGDGSGYRNTAIMPDGPDCLFSRLSRGVAEPVVLEC